MSALYQPVQGAFSVIPPTTDEIEDFFEQKAHYANAVKHLTPISTEVIVESCFESPHLMVAINGVLTRVDPISIGDDALLCVTVLGDDRLFFLMEARTNPIIRGGEEDDSILITTWHQRPGMLFGTDVCDIHFYTLEARVELLRQLLQQS